MQSERLLQAMQKTISHDLPNQIIVLQSLLQLLREEESDALGDEGREYVRRLIHATRRAGELARFLKELCRIQTLACKAESVSLAALSQELQGELQRIHADRHFEFDWRWSEKTIHGDSRVFLSALLELVAAATSPQSKRCLVSGTSELRDGAVMLLLRIDERMPGKAAMPFEPIDQRLEVTIACEWLHLCGATVSAEQAIDGVRTFSIRTPRS